MIAVAAQVVHFFPQLVTVGIHFGEALSQAQRLSPQHRELEGQPGGTSIRLQLKRRK
jgi:hypothetical protein